MNKIFKSDKIKREKLESVLNHCRSPTLQMRDLLRRSLPVLFVMLTRIDLLFWIVNNLRRFPKTEGVNESWRFHVEPGLGKDNRTLPYVMVHEWIAANIAQFLQLPIAPFGLFKRTDRRTLMFGSVSFDGDIKPRFAKPMECWREHPLLSTGIVAFEILIANSDRHCGNLKVDNPAKPKVIYVFDHDRCLLGTEKGKGVQRLKDLRGRLGISRGAVSGGNAHCLLDAMDTSNHFPLWLERIHDMPKSFLINVCEKADGLGASKIMLEEIVDFLVDRKDNMGGIIFNHRNAFPNIHDWPLYL